jgi:type IV secretory pathway VirJ component
MKLVVMPAAARRWLRAWFGGALLRLVAAAAASVSVSHAQGVAAPRAPASGAAPQGLPAGAPQLVTHGLFSDVQVYRPSAAAQQFVLLLSLNPKPDAAELQTVRTLLASGAIVAVVPLAPFYRRLELQDGKCTYGPGAFENLSRHLQAYEQVPGYLLPMLIGSGAAGTYAYALLAQAPAGIFASALSLGFCPRLTFKTPPCAVNALRWSAAAPGGGIDLQPAAALNARWAALDDGSALACPGGSPQAFAQRVGQGRWIAAAAASGSASAGSSSASPSPSPSPSPSAATDASAALRGAFEQLAVQQAPPTPPPNALAGLPIIELPVAAGTAPDPDQRFAVLLSGDGGWAGIDQGISAALLAKGIPVAGFDSLRYFWSARTPEGVAADLDRIIRYYAARWQRRNVMLIGFSQGADVLPFAINRLSADTRASVRFTALLALGQKASFEFHFANWIGPGGDRPIAPEASRLSAATTACLYGVEEKESLCPALAPAHVRAVPLAGGHHFSGNYAALAARVLEAAAAMKATPDKP